MKDIKNLPSQLIGKGEVKGFTFTKIKESEKAFIYEVDSGCSKKHYEVFRKKAKTNSVMFCFPTSKAFGIWAWCTNSLDRTVKIFDEINQGLR